MLVQIKNGLFISALALLAGGCLSVSRPTSVEEVSQAVFNYSEDSCKGAALTDTPFANSTTGGDGLTVETAYIICTAKQFNNIGSSSTNWTKYFVILKDINMIGYTKVTYNKIGSDATPFTGILNGNNKRLLNLTLNDSGTDHVGVFGALGSNGVIKNLQVSSIQVTGGDNVGILVGENQGGDIRNVAIKAISVSGASYVGGLVGRNSLGGIYDSSVTFTSGGVSVYGSSSYVGGLVGKIDDGLLQDSFIVGFGVQSGLDYAGGLVGANNSGGEIRSSYAKLTDAVSGVGNNIGGVVGNNDGLVYKSYAELASVTGAQYVGGIIGHNDAGLVQESYAKVSVQVNGVSSIGGGIGYNETGTILSSYVESALVTGSSDFIGGLVGWNKSGLLSGSHAMVTTVSSTGGSNVGGFVGFTETALAKIDNSYAETTDVTSDMYAGGLVGFNTGGEIKNSYAKSSGAITGSSEVGGFVGHNGSGHLSSNYADVKDVTATSNAGGFVGKSEAGSYISKCYVTSSGLIQAPTAVGGFVGYANAGEIIQSYALPTAVEGTTEKTGGFAGYLVSSFLHNVYVQSSQGTVTGITEVGGLVGSMDSSTIANSYSVLSSVTGTGEYVGGHTGKATSSNIDYAFAVGNVTGSSSTTPPTVGRFIGSMPAISTFQFIQTLTEVYFDMGTSECANNGDNPDTENILEWGYCNDGYFDTNQIIDELVFSEEYETQQYKDDQTYFYDRYDGPSFSGSWDFTNVWQENESDYPTLR